MQEILVIPRESVKEFDGFVTWPHASKLVDSVSDCVRWLPRQEAEHSEQLIQPIPCAIFRDNDGRYCVFRQAKHTRIDLSQRFSFIIGGHIDRGCGGSSVQEIFEETVKREISEEVGIFLNSQLKPVGMVIDSSSLTASRHIGFVYEAVVDKEIKPMAAEEFSVNSKYNGQFFSIDSLSKLRSKFDPWSFILFSQYLNGGFPMDIGRQPMLFTPTE